MAWFRVPDAPLPAPRWVRLAVLAVDGLGAAFTQALEGGGHSPKLLRWDDVLLGKDVVSGIELVVLAVPWPRVLDESRHAAAALAGKVVVSTAAAVGRDDDGFFARQLPEGSVTNALATTLSSSRVVGAFHFLSSPHLIDAPPGSFETDVPVVGDDREATDLVEALIDEIPGLTSVYAGRLSAAGAVEGLLATLRQVEEDRGRLVGIRIGEHGRLRLLD